MLYEHQATSFSNFTKNPGKQTNLLLGRTDDKISQTMMFFLSRISEAKKGKKFAVFGPILSLRLQLGPENYGITKTTSK